jgi:hypothetical protein
VLPSVLMTTSPIHVEIAVADEFAFKNDGPVVIHNGGDKPVNVVVEKRDDGSIGVRVIPD